MKTIIIPETLEAGDGKIKFRLEGDKIFYQILDTNKRIRFNCYLLKFLIDIENLKKDEKRVSEFIFIKIFWFWFGYSKIKEIKIIYSKQFRNIPKNLSFTFKNKEGEIKKEIAPFLFSFMERSFNNKLLKN